MDHLHHGLLAVAVGSPALYAPDCRSVRRMLLANGFCRFGEVPGAAE